MLLTMKRNTTKNIGVTVKQNGAAVNITGCSFYFTCKYDFEDPDSAKVFQKTVGSGITLTTPASGILAIKILPADTAVLPPHKTDLHYDLKMKDTNGNVYSVFDGTLEVWPDVTNSVS